jgi:hypothetical protein
MRQTVQVMMEGSFWTFYILTVLSLPRARKRESHYATSIHHFHTGRSVPRISSIFVVVIVEEYSSSLINERNQIAPEYVVRNVSYVQYCSSSILKKSVEASRPVALSCEETTQIQTLLLHAGLGKTENAKREEEGEFLVWRCHCGSHKET